MSRALTVILAGSVAVGCGSLLGVDGFEAVDCVGPCEVDRHDAGADVDEVVVTDSSRGDGDGPAPVPDPVTETTDASTDASVCATLPPCESGHRIAIRLEGGGGARVSSDPGGASVGTGETASACFPQGTRLRLTVSPESSATFAGAQCEDGNTTRECELNVSRAACIVATLP